MLLESNYSSSIATVVLLEYLHLVLLSHQSMHSQYAHSQYDAFQSAVLWQARSSPCQKGFNALGFCSGLHTTSQLVVYDVIIIISRRGPDYINTVGFPKIGERKRVLSNLLKCVVGHQRDPSTEVLTRKYSDHLHLSVSGNIMSPHQKSYLFFYSLLSSQKISPIRLV